MTIEALMERLGITETERGGYAFSALKLNETDVILAMRLVSALTLRDVHILAAHKADGVADYRWGLVDDQQRIVDAIESEGNHDHP